MAIIQQFVHPSRRTEERKTGTVELLLTFPVPIWAVVMGKYVAAWAFIAIALILTFPFWITVNFLGEPDNGVILASYLGSFIMAGWTPGRSEDL